MNELVATYWPVIIGALLLGIAVAWFVFAANRKAKVELDRTDVLDDGKGPAGRNQALIDAPPVSASPVTTEAREIAEVAPGLTSAAANLQSAAHVTAEADAEAGAPGSAREALQEMRTDDLTRIKGVGPKLVDLLAGMGVTRFEQIAVWSAEDIAAIDSQLGRFEGRIERDNWVEQARLLASGDAEGFKDRFGAV
ncbi:helix-hairpin-helix domain-containing protein [Parerythrobacter lacustris]|uniref:Helix-hairpin-helix domain-containing protein n=1 Tax=Parerythrobacter lacustris TaxID=2969984 RepID=A0ABT1XNF1_9SPHN|nr:helix-hairpin-helix domain-containing protein [Parerythrobacter lacustris]MCR2833184.1 helix-hairpin-helix domain-containing protein [Parerythrobacter lacustris]